jgi:PAS domain S-box-containing protein
VTAAALPTNEEIIRSVAAELPVGVWVARAPGGELVYANRKFQEILGMGARDDVASGEYAAPYGIRDRAGELYPEDRMPFVRALVERREVVIDDIVIHRPDGGRAFIRATARPMFDAAGEITHVVIAFIDISREVEAEKAREEGAMRTRQSERLESVGNLASGVAHDFNNLLAVIKALAESMRRTEQNAEKIEHLWTIDAMADSAAKLTRGLLSFAGHGHRGSTPVDLSSLVARLARMMQRALDRRIEVSFETATELAVLGDETSFEQVVMNLMINARDAMPDGGTLVLRTREEGARVILEVSDTGPGIPAAIRGRIFEPYFTSKQAGSTRGTGLGLATVHGVVALYEGTIEVLDNAPRGTTMRLSFPGQPAPARVAAPRRDEAPAPAPAPVPGSGLVMVVDDEAKVRGSTALLLEVLGYQVIEADGGERAIELYRARGNEIRAVLLDLTMPRMDGEATFRALQGLDPEVRVLLTTGFSLDARAKALLDLGVAGFLGKPYGVDALAQALRGVLR